MERILLQDRCICNLLMIGSGDYQAWHAGGG